ncbi:unknown [Eubacterium sp. CAG:192]|nr:unknown [Eubacterium sp. CAG:192]
MIMHAIKSIRYFSNCIFDDILILLYILTGIEILLLLIKENRNINSIPNSLNSINEQVALIKVAFSRDCW